MKTQPTNKSQTAACVNNRMMIYTLMLHSWMRKPNYVGFCQYLYKVHGLDTRSDENFKHMFPELYAQRVTEETGTLDSAHYHYPGTDDRGRLERVDALKRAIDLCRKTIRKSQQPFVTNQ